MKLIKLLIISFFMFALVYGITNSTNVNKYIDVLKNQQILTKYTGWDNYINSYSAENDIQPIEPRIDPVWKLIPGYNGLMVDKYLTLQLANKQKPSSEEEILFVWEEVEPNTKLKELGAYPIYRGNPEKPSVSFMINVAWGTEYLDSILDTLKNENVKATFFLDGSWLSKNPEMAKKIVADGHEIGNHAYSHPQMSRLSSERIREEILKTENLIHQVTGQYSTYFAPPSGDFDQRVVDTAYELNLDTVLWTIDTIDWKKPSKETIIDRIVPNIDNGYLILMHPTEVTAEVLPELIDEIKKKGLKTATVKETLSTNRILQVEYNRNF